MSPGQAIAVRINLGGVRLDRATARGLDVGCIVELECMADDPVELQAGGRRVARGQAVAVDGKIGVQVREVIATVGG